MVTRTPCSILIVLHVYLLCSWNLVNSERSRGIAFGNVVDFGAIKTSYSFMARFIMDGKRCGGALIDDRFVSS